LDTTQPLLTKDNRYVTERFLHASPHHGAGGGNHDAPDPQQNGGALKQNARTQARGV
jgi:hypothetical protein